MRTSTCKRNHVVERNFVQSQPAMAYVASLPITSNDCFAINAFDLRGRTQDGATMVFLLGHLVRMCLTVFTIRPLVIRSSLLRICNLPTLRGLDMFRNISSSAFSCVGTRISFAKILQVSAANEEVIKRQPLLAGG